MKLWLLAFLAVAAWAPAVQAQGVSRQARDTQQPRVISKTEPEYSEEARRADVNATIVLSLVVNEIGEPEDVRVERGAGFGLDERAVQCIQTWRFEPGTKDGKPFKAAIHVEVSFNLMTKGRQNQRASLTFTLPSGAARPELIKGAIPASPDAAGAALLRVRLTVGQDGKAKNLDILETTDQDWANQALKKMKEWRFRTSHGQNAEVQGVFELTVGHPKRRTSDRGARFSAGRPLGRASFSSP
jgi:TonB family protein